MNGRKYFGGSQTIPRTHARPYLRHVPQLHAPARVTLFSRLLLRSVNFLLQNCAIQRNAMRISLLWIRSEKHAVQRREKLRKSFSLNHCKQAKENKLPATLRRLTPTVTD